MLRGLFGVFDIFDYHETQRILNTGVPKEEVKTSEKQVPTIDLVAHVVRQLYGASDFVSSVLLRFWDFSKSNKQIEDLKALRDEAVKWRGLGGVVDLLRDSK